MELTIINTKGKKTTKKVKLNDAVFAIEPNDHAIYLDVKQYMANQRQGTHKSKERGEITGSRRKIRKQKGTGFARAGDIKNPIYRGGGRVFGPVPRDHGFKVNKKVKMLARKSVLTYKAIDKCLFIVEDFSFDSPKTKQYAELLNNLSTMNERSILVLPESDNNVILSSRNIKNAVVTTANKLSSYEILRAKNLALCSTRTNL